MNDNQKKKREQIDKEIEQIQQQGLTGRLIIYLDMKMGAIARIFKEVKEEIRA